MKKIFFALLLFVSINSFSQSLPYPPGTLLKGYVPALTGVPGQFLNYLGQWAAPTSGNPTLFNALLYGAVNDGQFARHASSTSGSHTITCLSCNFLSTTLAVIGQSFRMDSAGTSGAPLITTISGITDNTHITVTTASGTTVTSKSIVWGTDNTAAITNVLDTIFVHGGGTLFLPGGGYIIAGSPISPTSINAQIPLPVSNRNDTTFNLRTGINIQGVANANLSASAYANDTINAHTGTWIESIVDAPDVSNISNTPSPAVFGSLTQGGTTNYNYFVWQNLIIFVPANVGSGGPKMGGINCNACAISQGYDVLIANDGSMGASDQPIHEVAGWITNRIGSELTTSLNNVWVSGFKYGVVSSDHAVFNNMQLFGDYYGVVAIAGSYPITFVHVGTQECNTDIYAPATQILGNITPGAARIEGTSWQIETLTSAPSGNATWYLHNKEVSDSGNNITGDLNYFSNRNDLFTKFNGANAICTQLGQFANFPTPNTRTLPIGDSNTISNIVTFNYANSGSTPYGLIKGTMHNVDQLEQVFDNEGKYYGTGNANSGRNIYWYDVNGSKYLGGIDAVGQWWLGPSNSNFGLRVSNATSGRSAAILASGDVTFGDTITTAPFRWDATNKRLDIGGGTPGSFDINVVRNQTGVNVGEYIQNANAGGFTSYRALNDGSVINQFGIYGSAATAYGAIHAGFANSYTTAPNSVIMIDNGSPELDVALGSGGVAAQYKFLPTTFAPTTNITYDLGTSSLGWRELFLGAGTTSVAQLNLTAGTKKTSMVAGDLTYVTGHLYFHDGSTDYDLLNPAGATTLYSGDGTLAGNRSVSGGTNTLSLGTSGSKVSALTVNSSAGISLQGQVQYGTYQPGDANITVPNNVSIVELPIITANRTITLPTMVAGSVIHFYNTNTSNAFQWSFTNTVVDADGNNNIVTLRSGRSYDVLYDGTIYILKDPGIGYPTQTLFTSTANGTVANTGSATSIVGTGVGSMTLPANFFYPGKTIRLKIAGVYSLLITTPGNLTITIKIGSTTIATGTISNFISTGPTNQAFNILATITSRSSGTTQSIMIDGQMQYENNTVALSSRNVLDLNNAGSTTTVTTNANALVDVLCTWQTTSTSNTISSTICTLETVN